MGAETSVSLLCLCFSLSILLACAHPTFPPLDFHYREWLLKMDSEDGRRRDDLLIHKLIAELVDLEEPESSESYLVLSDKIKRRSSLNLNGILENYSSSIKSKAVAIVFKMVKRSSVQSILLRGNGIDGESMTGALVIPTPAGFRYGRRPGKPRSLFKIPDPSSISIDNPGGNSDAVAVHRIQSAWWRGLLLDPMYQSLEILDLSSNSSIGNTGVICLAEFLHMRQFPRLRELLLEDIGMGDEGLSQFAVALQRSGLHNSLEVLDVSHNSSMGGPGGKYLRQALTRFTHLRQLHLQDTGIGAEGVREIALVLSWRHLEFLEVLDFSFNSSIGNKGVLFLAESLRRARFKQLRELRLRDIGMEDEALQDIATLFRHGHCKPLQVLDLSSNPSIGNQGVLVLAANFGSDKSGGLKQLLLSCTGVGDEGVLSIAEAFALGHLENLQLVDVRKTMCTDKNTISFADGNKQLTFYSEVLRWEPVDNTFGLPF